MDSTFISALDMTNKTLVYHQEDCTIKYIDSTHVSVNGVAYHIAQLDENPHYNDILKLINGVRLNERKEHFKSFLYEILNRSLKLAAYKVATDTQTSVAVDDHGFSYTLEFDNPDIIKKFYRTVHMPSTLKKRLKRKVKWFTPDDWDNKIMIGKDMFGRDLIITDNELNYFAKIYKGWI